MISYGICLCLPYFTQYGNLWVHPCHGNGILSFFFYGTLYMYQIFFTCSSIDRHLSCFHVLAIVNSAQWRVRCVHPFGLWFSLDVCPGIGLLDHMVALFSVFKGTSILFSILVVPVYIPTNSEGGGPLPPYSFARVLFAFLVTAILTNVSW